MSIFRILSCRNEENTPKNSVLILPFVEKITQLSSGKRAGVLAAIILTIGGIVTLSLLAKFGYLQVAAHQFSDAMKSRFFPFMKQHILTPIEVAMTAPIKGWATTIGAVGGVSLGIGSVLLHKKNHRKGEIQAKSAKKVSPEENAQHHPITENNQKALFTRYLKYKPGELMYENHRLSQNESPEQYQKFIEDNAYTWVITHTNETLCLFRNGHCSPEEFNNVTNSNFTSIPFNQIFFKSLPADLKNNIKNLERHLPLYACTRVNGVFVVNNLKEYIYLHNDNANALRYYLSLEPNEVILFPEYALTYPLEILQNVNPEDYLKFIRKDEFILLHHKSECFLLTFGKVENIAFQSFYQCHIQQLSQNLRSLSKDELNQRIDEQ